MREAIINKRQD